MTHDEMIVNVNNLLTKTKLAIGSYALLEKQLILIRKGLDNIANNCYDESIRGEKEESHSDSFLDGLPVSVYEEDVK